MSEERLEDSDEPTPTRTKVVAGLVGCVVVTAAMYGMLRMSSPPVSLGQAPPAGHYSLSCPLCHTASADVRVAP